MQTQLQFNYENKREFIATENMPLLQIDLRASATNRHSDLCDWEQITTVDLHFLT